MDRRTLLIGLSSGVAVAGTQTQAASRLNAAATRLDPAKVRLTWNASAGSARVLTSSEPNANLFAMKEIAAAVQNGLLDVAAPISPRPYFLIRTRSGGQVRIAERLLPLEGGRNFRDLGGYAAHRGKNVRWGKIYRSGVMAKFTTNDTAYLRSLGIAVICDLRSGQERSREPSALLGSNGVKTLSKDYEMGSSLNKLMAAKTKEEAVVIFGDAYIDFAQTLAPQYKEMFESLLENKAPLAVNCTAGKDRTGVASALILSVLGVDRATVVADYALSQTFVPPSYYLNQASGATAAQTSPFARLPRPVAEVILGSDPGVMQHALGRMDREFGGPVGLAKKQFGLTDAAIAKLRADYLV